MRARIFTIWLVSFVVGSMVAPLVEVAPQVYLLVGLTCMFSSLFIYNKRYVFAVIFAVGLLLISVSLFQTREQKLLALNKKYSAKSSEMMGYISSTPTKNEYGQTLTVVTTEVSGRNERLKLKLYVPAFPEFQQGQQLIFDIKLKPYGDKKWRLVKDGYVGEASLSEYRDAGKVAGLPQALKFGLSVVRTRFNEAIGLSLPAAEAGLASGLILGEKALLTPEVTRQLQISGTTHIIALSGYNITIILGLFVLFKDKLSRLANLLVPLLFIILFVIMTGGAASLVRASIMGFLPLLAIYLGRESDGFIAILCSAAIMIAFNPFLALYDVGFQLSFVALSGMIYLAPLVARVLRGFPDMIAHVLSETTGAQLAAMPLLAYYFGSVSLISPLANLVILSFVPLGMLTAFMIGLLGTIWQPLATFVAVPGYVVLHTINLLIAFFGSIPAASKNVEIKNLNWILLIYVAMFAVWLTFYKVRRERPTN